MKQLRVPSFLCIVLGIFLSNCTGLKASDEVLQLSTIDATHDIIEKINNGKFDLVESYIDYLLRSPVVDERGVNKLDDIYSQIFGCLYTEVKLEKLETWCSESRHHAAYLIKGLFYIKSAWKKRSDGWAIHVSDEQFAQFYHDLELAKNFLETAYSINKKDAFATAAMQIVSRGFGNEQQEEYWFHKGLEINPSSFFVYSYRLTSLLPKWGGSWEQASELIKNAEENDPPCNLSFLLRLALYEQLPHSSTVKEKLGNPSYKEQLSQVLKIKRKYHELYPGSKFYSQTFLRLEGRLYYMMGRYSQASDIFHEMTELDPNNDWPWYMLGQMNNKIYQFYGMSIDFLDKAISISPMEKMYYDERGIVAGKAGMSDLCISDLTKSLEMVSFDYNRTTWFIPYYRGYCYAQNGEHKFAITDYTIAFKMRPDEVITLRQRAQSYRYEKQYDDAISDLEKYLEHKPNDSFAKDLLKSVKVEKQTNVDHMVN